MLSQFIFSENTPAAPGTAVSANPVTGASYGMPAGVCGRLDDYEGVMVVAELTGKAADGTAVGGNVDVSLQSSPDDGASWFETVRFATVSSGASVAFQRASLSLWSGASSPVAVAKGQAAPVLTAASGVSGAFGSKLRLLITSGSGTTKSAAVVVRLQAQRRRLREAGGR